jgi:hypothetical protein
MIKDLLKKANANNIPIISIYQYNICRRKIQLLSISRRRRKESPLVRLTRGL